MNSLVGANVVRSRCLIVSTLQSLWFVAVLVSSVTVAVMFSSPANSADFVVDESISSPGASETVRLMLRDRIASYGDIVATHYLRVEYNKDAPPGTHYVVIENQRSGTKSTITLPGMSHVPYPFTDSYQLDQSGQYVTADFAGHAMTSENDLWVLAQNTDSDSRLSTLALKHYRFAGAPMPTEATLVAQYPLGNAFSRAHGLLRLQSGALVATWFQHEDGAGTDELVLGFGYRSPAGAVSQNFPVSVPSGSSTGEGRYSKSRYAAAQHPATNDLWVFSKRDSSGQLQALRLMESGEELVVAEILPSFINRADNDEDGPEGEWPDLHARAIPARDTIQLIYHRNDYRIWTGNSDNGIGWFKKGARLGLAEIAEDGTVDFATQRFPDYVERVTRFGVSSTDAATWVLYQRVDGTYPVTTVSDYAIRFDNSERTWGSPVKIEDARSGLGEFGVARAGVNGSHRFATRHKVDGQLHNITIGSPSNTPWLLTLEHVAIGDKLKLRWTTTADANISTFKALRDSRGDNRYFEVLDAQPESDGVRWSIDVAPCPNCSYRLAGFDENSAITYSNAVAAGESYPTNNVPAPTPTSPPPTNPEPTPEPEPQTPPVTPPAPPADPVPTPQPQIAVSTEVENEVESLDPAEIYEATVLSRYRVRLKWHTVPFAHAYNLERGVIKSGAMVWKEIATTYGTRAKFRDKRKPGTWWYRVKARQFTNELQPAYGPTIKVVIDE